MVRFSRRIQNLIATFRGLPRDNAVSVLREERSLRDLLPDILKKYTGTVESRVSGEILTHWPAIVGEEFCPYCTPHKISPRGVLMVKVRDSVVRQELFFKRDAILGRIRRLCPEISIGDVVFSL
ncbi:MAG: DUF721 domain-containing protein [Puniceicoccales bacterium]|jgi:hypothetical protein|nr:DUF721 domain-containing protein [Puniceicoccales bacterium]